MFRLPTISIIIPTLNSQKTLKRCLNSIVTQKYPKSKIEIIVVDGGSADDTLETAKSFSAKVVFNKLKTAEAGKAVGVKETTGELIALIDSDNILPNDHWLVDMIAPFIDKEIILTEPIRYSYRKSDPVLTRYFALLGMNDPICLFIGNYDRFSYLTNRWTDLKFSEVSRQGYKKIKLDNLPIPTIGANGTMYRSSVLKKALAKNNYLFDIDVLIKIIKDHGAVYIAKVQTGIVHTFVEDSLLKFFKKQLRRVNDMSFHRSTSSRELNWEVSFMTGIIKFIFSCLLFFPILYQTLLGFKRKPDPAWLFHPIACYSTLIIYIYGWIRGKISPSESSRQNWKQ